MDIQNLSKTPVGETLFALAYRSQSLIVAKIGTPSYRVLSFNEIINYKGPKGSLNL